MTLGKGCDSIVDMAISPGRERPRPQRRQGGSEGFAVQQVLLGRSLQAAAAPPR